MQFAMREKSNRLSYLQGHTHPKSRRAYGLILFAEHPVKLWHKFRIILLHMYQFSTKNKSSIISGVLCKMCTF